MTTWTVADICALMERWYPAHTAESWDKVGLIAGGRSRTVRRVYLALDPVRATVEEAIDHGADMMITHHPLLLRGASFLSEDDAKGAILAQAARAHLRIFHAHTNADVAHGGVAHSLANLLELRDQEVLSPSGVDAEGRVIGLGRVGHVTPMSLADYARLVAERLPAGPNGLLVAGPLDMEVRTVAVSGGSGDHFLEAAREAGADAYVSADLRHHPVSEHCDNGTPAVICTSHWASEAPWLPVLADKLRDAAREASIELEVEVSTIVTEPWTQHLPTKGSLL